MVPLLRVAASLRVRGDGGAGRQPLHQGDTEHTLPPLHRKEGNSSRERERERSPQLSYIPVSPWWPTSSPGRFRTPPPSATSRGRKQHQREIEVTIVELYSCISLVANLSTREIQNTPSLRYIERKETALERERSPQLSSRFLFKRTGSRGEFKYFDINSVRSIREPLLVFGFLRWPSNELLHLPFSKRLK